MSVADAILATLAAESSGTSEQKSSIHGRTLLHKKIYFLSVLADEAFGFRPHYYGPYSPQVSTTLSALVEAGFVEESQTGYGAQGPFGEVVRYDYKLTESGRAVVESKLSVLERYYGFLSKINDPEAISDLRTMAVAAKVFFIVSFHGKATIDLIRKEAKSLGWSLPNTEIDGVISYLTDGLGILRSNDPQQTPPG